MKVIFRPQAVEDIIEAVVWYEAHAPGLGEELVDEILVAIKRAADYPGIFPIVHSEGRVRRVLTKRFPYRIFFSRSDFDLYVHAVLHGARHDRRLTERL